MIRSISMQGGATGALALAAALTFGQAPAAAAPGFVPGAVGTPQSLVAKTQGVYFGFSYGRPYRGYYGRHSYRPRYGYSYGYRYPGPYRYRSYYYGAPRDTVYYTRPRVVERARPSYDADAVARCASRFRSFRVDTGTYVTYGGEERLCPYLR